jgi:hypothetical protein
MASPSPHLASCVAKMGASNRVLFGGHAAHTSKGFCWTRDDDAVQNVDRVAKLAHALVMLWWAADCYHLRLSDKALCLKLHRKYTITLPKKHNHFISNWIIDPDEIV